MSIEKARQALSFVPSDDRDTWVAMAMAIKSEFNEEGFDAWDQWSQGSESYNARDAKAVWRSVSPFGKKRIGSLFHEAAARGWRDNGEHRGPLTADEIAEKQRKHDARIAAEKDEMRRKELGYQKSAELAQVLIDACAKETHYYLNSKGFPDALGLVADGVLVVPMRNAETNVLQGAQTIEWNPETREYEKKMIHGMRAKGAVLRLGPPHAPEIYLCEGYATGLSIEAAIRQLRMNAATLICFSASNLVYVAPKIKGRLFVVADNDKSTMGESSAKKTGLPYCMSPVLGEDANDLHQRAGLLALCSMLMKVRM